MLSEALQADCLSGKGPWAEAFVPKNFQFESWCGRCRPFPGLGELRQALQPGVLNLHQNGGLWINEHVLLLRTVNFYFQIVERSSQIEKAVNLTLHVYLVLGTCEFKKN